MSSDTVNGSTVGSDLFSTFNNVLGRVADLATLDFLSDRGLVGSQPERIVEVQPVSDIQGPNYGIVQNPWVIGGALIAAAVVIVLLVRK